MTPLLAAVAAMSLLGGLLLIGSGLRRRPLSPAAPGSTTPLGSRLPRWTARDGRLGGRSRALLLGGLAAGGGVWLLSG